MVEWPFTGCSLGYSGLSDRSHLVSDTWLRTTYVMAEEGSVLFNDTLNTFYLQLYCILHKDHSNSGRGKPLLPHGLLIPISSKGSFICIIPQTG